jgi:uncharacterized repeat protein (TIGR01451 family)
LANIGRNQSKAVSYKVDFSDCNEDGTTFTNTAKFSGKNISPTSASYTIQLLKLLSAGVQYFKTLLNGGTVYYGDVITYQLHLNNVGPVRMEDIHFKDFLPPELELVSADIISSQGGNVHINGTTITFDFSGCINSQYFDTPNTSHCYGNPYAATATIKAKVKTPADACSISSISNTATYDVYKVSATHYNDDASMSGTHLSGAGTKSLSVYPLKGDLALSLYGPSSLQVKDKGSYSITVANKGKDTALNTMLTISVPKLSINGVEKYVSIINVEGGIVDYSDIVNGKIYIALAEIGVGRSKQINFQIGTIPSGIMPGTKINLSVVATADDDTCGSLSATRNIVTTITSNSSSATGGQKSLYLYKTSKASYVLSKNEVEYQMLVQNIGSVITSEVYVVDIIPAKSSFVAAYTTATTAADTYSCAGCKVYFANTNANLPKKFDPLNPFTPAMVQNYFTLGTENNGVWTSPYGAETKYVAYLVDDTSKNPAILPTGGEGTRKI